MAEAVAAPKRDAACGGARLRKDQKHPLLGRAGEGPPIAPAGWGWRAGSRARDMYFYSPSGEIFRSQVQLNTYLASHPGSPSASEFWWTFRETDFQEGPLPGIPGTPGRRDAAQNKRQKLHVEEKDDDHHTSAAIPRASTPTASGQLSPSSTHRYGLNSILSSPTGHRVLLRNSGAMRKFLEEAAQLGKKSEAEIGELRDILLVKAQDLMSLRKYPKNALRVFFYLLRNEEAPSCFGVTELSDLCNSWLCKHMRPWCLRETHRIQTLAEKLQRQAQKKLVEQEMMPRGQTVPREAEANGTACVTNEQQEIHGDALDVVDLDDANQQEQPSVVGERCKCKACSTNPSFCSGCECNICKDVVHTKENWSYLNCEKCSHVCHLDCALEARRAGVVKDSGLDVEFLCPSCLQKTDLASFWKDRIKDALAVVDRGLLEKHLLAAVRVMAGTGKSAYQAIHARVEELHNAIVHDADCPDFHELLRQIGDPLGDLQLQQLSDCDDKFLDQSLLAEILEEHPIHSIQVEEAKVAEYQKQAEQDYVLWLKAEKHADARRSLVKQITQQLEKAEEEVKLRADCAASSRMLLQKSQKKLQMLEQIRGAQGISKERMQLQRSIFNRELSELQILQDKVVSLKPETWDGYLSQLSVLLEAMKSQRKRVEAAQERLEGLIALHKLVKQ